MKRINGKLHHDHIEHKDAFGNLIKVGDVVVVPNYRGDMLKAKVERFLPTKIECKYERKGYNGKIYEHHSYWRSNQMAIIDKLDPKLKFESDDKKEEECVVNHKKSIEDLM